MCLCAVQGSLFHIHICSSQPQITTNCFFVGIWPLLPCAHSRKMTYNQELSSLDGFSWFLMIVCSNTSSCHRCPCGCIANAHMLAPCTTLSLPQALPLCCDNVCWLQKLTKLSGLCIVRLEQAFQPGARKCKGCHYIGHDFSMRTAF